MRLVNALRAERPDIVIYIRGDAGFGVPSIYEACEQNRLFYKFGFAANERLKRRTQDLIDQAVRQYEQTKQKQRLFDCFDYQAESWSHPRRVVARAECHSVVTNLRLIVTNHNDVVSVGDGVPGEGPP